MRIRKAVHSSAVRTGISRALDPRRVMLACAVAAGVASVLAGRALAADAAPVPPAVAAAVADHDRPATDTERDANRKPAETLAFAGVKAGDKVADYAAGSGYFTRLFGDVVGPQGHVYAVVPKELFTFPNVVKGTDQLKVWAGTHPNITVTVAPALDGVKYPQPLDLFWISQNYHDLKDSFMGPVDIAAFNRAVYAALKPGGVYIVLDHVAAKGSPENVTDTLHRIEPATVRREVEAAGFQFESESSVLANPADPHTAGVFDKTIRGHTDQFIYKFRKPKA